MKNNVTFPESITDFLTWIKITTETAWSKASEDDFFYDAKWLPLSEQEIDDLEIKYAVRFGFEHRAFLRISGKMRISTPEWGLSLRVEICTWASAILKVSSNKKLIAILFISGVN